MFFPVVRRRIAAVEGIEHLPTDRSFIIAANHIDFLDGFYLTAALARRCHRRIRFLSETGNYWWTGGATIPVNPEDKAASIARAVATLAVGDPVCFFVEGKRNPSSTLLAPKTGLARLSAATGAPVVPVGITGPSGKTFLESIRLLLSGRPGISVRIGQALTGVGLVQQDSTDAGLRATMDRVMVALAPLCGKQYSPQQ